jgi:cation diffusion facilitator family transporter
MSRKEAIHTSWWSIGSNFVLALVKAFVGIAGNSFALVADAVESATDVVASVIVWLGIRYSTRPADENHPYGHGRAEGLITFIVSAFLIVSGTTIAVQGVQNLFKPQPTPEPYTLAVLAAIILGKELLYRYVHAKGVRLHSTSLQADAWHHRSDAITSVVAFVGVATALWMGPGWEKADDIAAIAAAGVIYYNAYRIFRPALREIMDENSHEALIAALRHVATTVPGIAGTEKCHIRKLGMVYMVDLHAQVDGNLSVTDGHRLAHALKDAIRNAHPEVAEVLVHIEPTA